MGDLVDFRLMCNTREWQSGVQIRGRIPVLCLRAEYFPLKNINGGCRMPVQSFDQYLH